MLEYAFNTNPRVVNLPTGLPTVALVTQGASTANQITFTRRVTNPEVTYIVETSGDLQNWDPAGATQVLPADPGNGVTQSVVFRDNTPRDASHPKRFIRVRVTRP